MEKWLQIKRNHHYVWAHYLSAWATKGNVYYLTTKGKVACDSIKGLCRDREFYAIHKLSDEDVAFVQQWISKASEFLQEQHRKDLADFVAVSDVWRIIERVRRPEEISELKDVIRCNSLENKYTIIESEFYSVIEAIKEQGPAALNDKSAMLSFCSYVGHQVTRTKSFRDRSIEAIRQGVVGMRGVERYVYLTERNWWLLSYIFGTNVGAELYFSRENDHHVIINNCTDTPFITGFHPLANVHECVADVGVSNPPEYMDLYFPLTPNIGYMFNQSPDYNHLRDFIDDEEVRFLNMAVARQSDGRVIGSTSAVIDEIRKQKITA